MDNILDQENDKEYNKNDHSIDNKDKEDEDNDDA